MADWKPANQPPAGEVGYWTPEVVVLTNYGDVFSLSYFHSVDDGCWQRPRRFNKGEKVAWWIERPETKP